jgi:hypothetical protein
MIRKIKLLHMAGMLICLCLSASTLAKQGSYKRCHSISKQIENIDIKRKRGGSAKQMEAWRKKRHQLSDQAYQLRCRKHGIIR